MTNAAMGAMRELARRMTGDADNKDSYMIRSGGRIVAFSLTWRRANEWARFYKDATITKHAN